MFYRLWRIIKGLWYLAFPSARELLLSRYRKELEAWDKLVAGGDVAPASLPACVPRYRWVKIKSYFPTWKLLDCEKDMYVTEIYRNYPDVFTYRFSEYRTLEMAQKAALACLGVKER